MTAPKSIDVALVDPHKLAEIIAEGAIIRAENDQLKAELAVLRERAEKRDWLPDGAVKALMDEADSLKADRDALRAALNEGIATLQGLVRDHGEDHECGHLKQAADFLQLASRALQESMSARETAEVRDPSGTRGMDGLKGTAPRENPAPASNRADKPHSEKL